MPRPHDPFLDLVPPQGVKLTPRHYAYVKISEGCNNLCSFCIIPALRGRLKSRPLGDVMREAERLVAAGVQELLVISQDTSAYGLDLGYATSAWRGQEHETRFLESRRGARLARRLGAPALRLSLSACRSGHAADGRGAGAALSRHSLPACEPESAEGDAPAGASGEDLGAHRALARNLSRSCHPLDLHRRLPRRDRGGLRSCCSTGWPKRSSSRVGCFKYENVDGAAANALPARCPRRLRRSATTG